MTSNQKNVAVFALTTVLVGIPTTVLVLTRGSDVEALGLVLRITARTAMLLYILVFIARPLRQLTSTAPAFLTANRRHLGIAMSAVMTVHLGFIVWLHGFVIDVRIPSPVLIAGGFAYSLMYLMLITSFDRSAALLGRRNWRRLHKTGLFWIGIVFAYTLVAGGLPLGPIRMLLAILFVAAVALRFAAAMKKSLKHGSG